MLIPNKIVHFNNIGLFYALLSLTIPIIAIETADTFPADFLHNPHKKNIVQKKNRATSNGCSVCVYTFVTCITRHAM